MSKETTSTPPTNGDGDNKVAELPDLTGLALSGGGIRSATFCLGLLQSLARHDKLKNFDYLSVVSGGSWIGSSVAWFWSQHNREEKGEKTETKLQYGLGPDDFPYNNKPTPFKRASMDPRKESVWLRGANLTAWLRSRAKIISPGFGFGIMALLGAILRAVIINLLLFIPPLFLAFTALRQANDAFLLNTFICETVLLDSLCQLPFYQQVYLALLIVYVGIMVSYSIFSRIVKWFTYKFLDDDRKTKADDRFFRFRGHFTKGFGLFTGFILMASAIASFPLLEQLLSTFSNKELWTGATAVLSGLLSWFAGTKQNNHSQGNKKRLTTLLVPLGSCLFLYALLFTLYLASQHTDPPWQLICTYWWAVLIWITLALFPDINFNSMHRYYRDRLMVAFLPDPVLQTQAPNFSDRFRLSQLQSVDNINLKSEFTLDRKLNWWDKSLWWVSSFFKAPVFTAEDVVRTEFDYIQERRMLLRNEATVKNYEPPSQTTSEGFWNFRRSWLVNKKTTIGNKTSPYLLINTTLTTTDSSNRKLRGRGFAHFLLSGNFVGSDATGYRLTREYLHDHLTLATAMGISGAAVDPNTYATNNRFLSIIMALFNVRTGFWAPNPRPGILPYIQRNVPYWFAAIYREMNGVHLNEKAKFIHLSDGGHSDNLGIYELIRRRCRFILAIDAGADKDWSWGDLGRVVEQVRVDFGVDICLHEDRTDSESRCPGAFKRIQPNIECPGLPYTVSERPWLLARINYPPTSDRDGSENAWLLLVKSTLPASCPHIDVHAYKRFDDDFPDQSTSDQFFDEPQFEAYRQLGFDIGEAVLKDPALPDEVAAYLKKSWHNEVL